jgi:hypothetical protein
VPLSHPDYDVANPKTTAGREIPGRISATSSRRPALGRDMLYSTTFLTVDAHMAGPGQPSLPNGVQYLAYGPEGGAGRG